MSIFCPLETNSFSTSRGVAGAEESGVGAYWCCGMGFVVRVGVFTEETVGLFWYGFALLDVATGVFGEFLSP